MNTTGCNSIKGYVRVDSQGNNLLNTFTLQDMSNQIGWTYIEVACGPNNIPSNSTTTYSSTTTTWTTPNPTTTSTTSTSTTSTSTSTTSTSSTSSTTSSSTSTTSSSTTSSTSTSTSSTSTTSSTTTTTTTLTTTSTTTSTSTSTTSSTTTTTTTGTLLDVITAVVFSIGTPGDPQMAGTRITGIYVNGVLVSGGGSYPMQDGDTGGGFITINGNDLIEVYIDRGMSVNPSHVASNIRIELKPGNVFSPPPPAASSPPGLTSFSPDIIAFNTGVLGGAINSIVIVGNNNP